MKTIIKMSCHAFALFAFAWFGLLPALKAFGVVPPPDGGYPNFTTAAGDNALQALTLGLGNTALGTFSLFSVTTGSFNTAVGAGSLDLNTADSNTAVGAAALLFNTAGADNTAVGAGALEFNETGSQNTAHGASALFSNTTGFQNTAVGPLALAANTTGNFNTAIGSGGALWNNTTGGSNTAIGTGALINNTTGGSNTAIGLDAGFAVVTADSVIAIGIVGADVSNTTWINNVYGVTTQSGTTAPVIVSDTGQLGTVVSSERFKKDIAGMEKASETILSLRPVTFHYKTDTKGTSQFGLIAEEVEKVNPALVLPDRDGKPYTVRYDAVNAMLLNEFLKEHRKVEQQQATITQLKSNAAKQEATIAELKSGMQALTATVTEQASQIQKVSAQLEASKSAPQVVNNP